LSNELNDNWKTPLFKLKIKSFENSLHTQICSELPNAFWNRKQHMVDLPYEKEFSEKMIPTKAQAVQLNEQVLEHCKKEIDDLLTKGIISKSKSPWSCSAFYVNKAAEIERGTPRLVINYK